MTIQQLKRALAELRGAIKPETSDYQLIIYDHTIRGDSEGRNIESILKINGRDVSNFTLEEKEKNAFSSQCSSLFTKKRSISRG